MNTLSETKPESDFIRAISAHLSNICEIDAQNLCTALGPVANRYFSCPYRLKFGTGGNRFYVVSEAHENLGKFTLEDGFKTLDEVLARGLHSFECLVIVQPEPQKPVMGQGMALASIPATRQTFKSTYVSCLEEAVKENPALYSFPVEQVPTVAERMFDALYRGTFSHQGLAMKKLAKRLGIKSTRSAIVAAWEGRTVSV